MNFIRKLQIFSKFAYKIPFYYQNWPTVFLDYARLLKGKEIIYKLRSGEKFFARGGNYDIVTLNEVFLSRIYEDFSNRVELKRGDVVLDVGASIGDFTVWASKRVGKSGRVYSFEPAKEAFELLKRNVELNKCKNVSIYNFGLARKTGKVTFYYNGISETGNSIYKDKQWENKLTKGWVMVKGVNDFITNKRVKKIDFLKMDCEGAEFDILYSLDKSVLKKVRCIVMEYHLFFGKNMKMHTAEQLTRYLKGFGFAAREDKSNTDINAGIMYCRNSNVS